MKHRLATVVALSASAVALALPAATAAPADDHHTSFTDTAGDAPPAVDIVKTSLRHSKGAYRADVTFTKLRKQKSDRWVIGFLDFGSLRHTGKAALIAAGNFVELRVNPNGKQSAHAYVLGVGSSGPTVTPRKCKGVTAKPDYQASRIHFVIPNKCWKPTSGTVGVTDATRHYTDGTWDTSSIDSVFQASDGNEDQSSGPWNYAGTATN